MFTYQVNDMTCGHCVSAITKAVLAVDSGATVEVDLAEHIVRIESSNAADDLLKQAIQGAGYEPHRRQADRWASQRSAPVVAAALPALLGAALDAGQLKPGKSCQPCHIFRR
jgi:copper chaperone